MTFLRCYNSLGRLPSPKRRRCHSLAACSQPQHATGPTRPAFPPARLSIDLIIVLTLRKAGNIVRRITLEITAFPFSGGFTVTLRHCLLLIAFALGTILGPVPLAAHHSTAEYDMTALTSVKGTVTQFEWSNPHAYIHITVKDDQGADCRMGRRTGQPRHALPRELEARHGEARRRTLPCTAIAPRTASR